MDSGQKIEALLESVGIKRFLPLLVVVGIVRVEPVAAAVYIEVGDPREFGSLDEELPLRNERCDPFDFGVIQMKLPTVQVLIHVGIGEKNFRGTALDDDVEKVRALQLVKRLRRENHGGIVFSPCFERLGDVLLDARIPKENPSLVDEERFERGGNSAIGNDFVRAMQDVEQQRFEEFRIPAHLLEVEALEARKGNGVLRIVEEKSELSAAQPLGESVRQISRQSVRQNIEGAQRRLERVEIFDLFVKRPIALWIELADGAAEKNFDEKGQEIEIGLGRRETKGIDGESGGFEP